MYSVFGMPGSILVFDLTSVDEVESLACADPESFCQRRSNFDNIF